MICTKKRKLVICKDIYNIFDTVYQKVDSFIHNHNKDEWMIEAAVEERKEVAGRYLDITSAGIIAGLGIVNDYAPVLEEDNKIVQTSRALESFIGEYAPSRGFGGNYSLVKDVASAALQYLSQNIQVEFSDLYQYSALALVPAVFIANKLYNIEEERLNKHYIIALKECLASYLIKLWSIYPDKSFEELAQDTCRDKIAFWYNYDIRGLYISNKQLITDIEDVLRKNFSDSFVTSIIHHLDNI